MLKLFAVFIILTFSSARVPLDVGRRFSPQALHNWRAKALPYLSL
ncbi:hypothetical protein BMETH_2081_0 [methanotrophic bacterial endosymbiont of Bathymodiolus sp.]|nr:hypothetical protein BMETH_2081_0 [methanotrophic bacterial endosymbiont of Bathymodiolus sp.]